MKMVKGDEICLYVFYVWEDILNNGLRIGLKKDEGFFIIGFF